MPHHNPPQPSAPPHPLARPPEPRRCAVTSALAVVDVAEAHLAAITTLPEAVRVREEVEALRRLARRARKSLALRSRLALVGVLAEHRAGMLLAELERTPGARTDLEPPDTVSGGSPYRRAIAECSLNERTAERWQHLARWLDEQDLQDAYGRCTQAGEEFTRAAVYDVADWRRYEAAQVAEAPGLNVSTIEHTRFAFGRDWLRPLPRRTTLPIEYDRSEDCRRAAEQLDRVAYRNHTGRSGALQILLRRYAERAPTHNGTA